MLIRASSGRWGADRWPYVLWPSHVGQSNRDLALVATRRALLQGESGRPPEFCRTEIVDVRSGLEPPDS